jgi:hypothetical protein
VHEVVYNILNLSIKDCVFVEYYIAGADDLCY